MSNDELQLANGQLESAITCSTRGRSQSTGNAPLYFTTAFNSSTSHNLDGTAETNESDFQSVHVKSCLVRRPSSSTGPKYSSPLAAHTTLSFELPANLDQNRDQTGCLSDPLPLTTMKPCCSTTNRSFSPPLKGSLIGSIESQRRHSHMELISLKRSSQSRSPPPPVNVVKAIGDNSVQRLLAGEEDEEVNDSLHRTNGSSHEQQLNDDLQSPIDAPPLAQAVVAALKHQHHVFRSTTTTTTSTASSSRFSPSYLSDDNEDDDGEYEDVDDGEVDSDVEELLAPDLVSRSIELADRVALTTDETKPIELDAESGYGASCSSSSTRLCRSNMRRDKRRCKRRIPRKANAGTATVKDLRSVTIDDPQQHHPFQQPSPSYSPCIGCIDPISDSACTSESRRSISRNTTTRHKRNRVRILDDSSPKLNSKPPQRNARLPHGSLNGFHSCTEDIRSDQAMRDSIQQSDPRDSGIVMDPSLPRPATASHPNLHCTPHRYSLDENLVSPFSVPTHIRIPPTRYHPDEDGVQFPGVTDSSSPNPDLSGIGPAPGAAMPPPADAVPAASILVSANQQLTTNPTNYQMPLIFSHRYTPASVYNDGVRHPHCQPVDSSISFSDLPHIDGVTSSSLGQHSYLRGNPTLRSMVGENEPFHGVTGSVVASPSHAALVSSSPPGERSSAFSPTCPDSWVPVAPCFSSLAEQSRPVRRFSHLSDTGPTRPTVHHHHHSIPVGSHCHVNGGFHQPPTAFPGHRCRHDGHHNITTCPGHHHHRSCPMHSSDASVHGTPAGDRNTPSNEMHAEPMLYERRGHTFSRPVFGLRCRSQAGSPPPTRTSKLPSNGRRIGASCLSDSPQHGRSHSAMEQRRYSVPTEPFYEVNLASPINSLSSGGRSVSQRVSLVVDNVRFLVDVDRLQAHPDTMLGRMFASNFSEASHIHHIQSADSTGREHDGSDSNNDSAPSQWTAQQSKLLTHPPDVLLAQNSNISAQLFRAILDYYLVGYMLCPPGVSVQELKEACDYFMIPFDHRTVRCSNLRAFLHELSNDGAHTIFERFLEAHILSLLVKCAQLGERECHVVIVTDEETIDWDPDYPPQMPENELHSHIIYSTQMFRFLKYIENREVAKQVLLERGLKKIRIGIEGYPTSKDRVKFRPGVRPEAIYNYVQCPFLRMSWEEEENKSRHVDFQCVKSKSVSDLTTGLEQAVVDPLPPHLVRSPLNPLRVASPTHDLNTELSSFGTQVDMLESEGVVAVNSAPEHSPSLLDPAAETPSPAAPDDDPSPDPPLSSPDADPVPTAGSPQSDDNQS